MMELGQMLVGHKIEVYEAPPHLVAMLWALSEELPVEPEWGGPEFVCDTFEMHPFTYDECACSYEKLEEAWSDTHDHADSCYRNELVRRFLAASLTADGNSPADPDGWAELAASMDEVERSDPYVAVTNTRDRIVAELCAEHDLDPECGWRIHCSCPYTEQWREWSSANDHDFRCPIVIPNFWHKSTDTRVHWYKHLGRSTTVNKNLTTREVLPIIQDCHEALDGLELKGMRND